MPAPTSSDSAAGHRPAAGLRAAPRAAGRTTETDVLVVGAGPAGAATAAWTASAGLDTLLIDAAMWPRDKTCGDGLTPRAVAELGRLGLADRILARHRNRGIELTGFGYTRRIAWPASAFGTLGSAMPRAEFDALIRDEAARRGAATWQGARAVDVEWSALPGRSAVRAVRVRRGDGTTDLVRCRRLVVADGVRSRLGGLLGRDWHRGTAYGVAARSYVPSDRHDAEWIGSDLELRDRDGTLQPGYGWVFPLGTGAVNVGVGALATAARPASVALRPLLDCYAVTVRDRWKLTGPPHTIASALLPMGGAVTGVAGPNWMLVGDAAACVNPLNGEGIDYGLEGGRLAAAVLGATRGTPVYTDLWPNLLREHYGAAFAAARRLAGLLTHPRTLPLLGPVGLGSQTLMEVAVRVMGNLITDADRDVVARLWRASGALARRRDEAPLFAPA